MTRFDRTFAALLALEGTRFTDDPHDNGGATRWGITLAALRTHRGDPSLTAEDVRALTVADAREVYLANYWREWMDDPDVPEYIAAWVFLNGVNEGIGTATKQAQRACGAKPDGKVGPETMTAFDCVEPDKFLVEAGILRDVRDRTLADYQRFQAGWTRRGLATAVYCAGVAG